MGPLEGVKIVELAGIGPGPMCAMLLAEMGATVLRVDRQTPSGLGIQRPRKYDLLLRSRGSVAVDLKSPEGVALVLDLVADADGLIEGFRPGVTERLGLGPEPCLARNPRLAYGRITGWGQEGPMARVAGHDLNYISLSGTAHGIGRAGQPPTIPLNLIGDFGGGALYLAMGVLAAIVSARATGRGQVVDAAMVDGAASLMTPFYGLRAAGMWNDERGTNLIDGGSHFCQFYECADGKWVSVAPSEAKFHDDLLRRLGIDPAEVGNQFDPGNWQKGRELLAARFRTRTRDEWCAELEGTDCCFAPVLSMEEAPRHPHMKARGTFVEVEGVVQPAPAPRFSGTPSPRPTVPQDVNPATADAALAPWLSRERIATLRAQGTIV